MNINDFIGIAIVGSILSFVVQYIKGTFGTTSNLTKGLTILLAIFVGALYVFLQGTVWWTTILGILAAASTVYALLLK